MTPHLERLGVDVVRTLERLKLYALEVIRWNRTVSNLISRNDEARFVERHLIECLEPAWRLRSCGARRWVDVGSGAGLPAIPLMLAGVGSEWTLVESRRKKSLFLRKILSELGLTNSIVVCARFETVAQDPEMAGRFEALTARATLALSPTLELASHVVAPGSHAFLWKGSKFHEESASDREWGQHWSEDGVLAVGGGPIIVAGFVRTTGS